MKFNDLVLRKRKIKFIGGLALALAFSAGLIFDYFESKNEPGMVIGDKENVIVLSPKGPIALVAKVDTGADFSSIDSALAESMGLVKNQLKRRVKNAQGIQVRDTVNIDYVVGNQEINTIVSVADRSQLSTDMIIGRSDMQGLLIDPNREFLTEPDSKIQRPTWSSFFMRAANRSVSKQLIILPILGLFVVLFRLVLGVRTFGVFAPVVIALSLILMQSNILQGILIYTALISIGVALKLLVFSKMQLPNVVEMFLIMVSVLLILVAFSFLPLSFQLTATTVFFPLIITTHIIERFSNITEEQHLVPAVFLLLETFFVAIILTFAGIFLVNRSMEFIWIVFAISIPVAIAAGNYTGLRLTELFRFDKLKKND
ncbi:MAG: 7TM domain-containing protein [Candidatus Moranbacteria bacterium]|nr:7TM domain-containing protein [Candidatus Moranbacteria bacterium]